MAIRLIGRAIRMTQARAGPISRFFRLGWPSREQATLTGGRTTGFRRLSAVSP